MGEIRKDYLLDRWVIIEKKRSKRPHQFKEKSISLKKAFDPFLPSNAEKYTSGETYRFPEKGKWKVRAIKNKFPAVEPSKSYKIHGGGIYTYSKNHGYHEVIIETPSRTKQLWDLNEENIIEILKGFKNRIKELEKKPGIKYVCIFKNHGPKAGTSIRHSHSQLIAFNQIPSNIKEKLKYYKGKCPHCSIIKKETKSPRKCFSNSSFVAFTPYASRFPLEIWIYSKDHMTNFHDLKDLAEVLKKTLKKLKKINASYNIEFYYAPKNTNLHFHIEILPRLTTWAGFEQYGTIINPVPPEEAAKFYRK